MKKLISIVLALVLCATLFAACGNDGGNAATKENGASQNGTSENSIVGTWTGKEVDMDVTYTFKADGTFTADYASGTYTISGDKITITANMNGQEFKLFDNVAFSVNGNTLTIDQYTYTKN